MINEIVAGDPKEPGAECGSGTIRMGSEVPDAVQCLEHDATAGIVRLVWIAQAAKAEGEEILLVQGEHFFQHRNSVCRGLGCWIGFRHVHDSPSDARDDVSQSYRTMSEGKGRGEETRTENHAGVVLTNPRRTPACSNGTPMCRSAECRHLDHMGASRLA